jgi:polysaccharide pyruvyl transferase WcaK-like protein
MRPSVGIGRNATALPMTGSGAHMTLEQAVRTRRADGGASLRVLIDSSTYRCRNIGDTAMLQVALTRLRHYWPRATIQIHSLDSERVRRLDDPCWAGDHLSAVRQAHLILMGGAGSLNDAFKQDALCRLEALEIAMDCGAVTALVGQGIGPMSNSVLRSQAARILPRVDFIALRDSIDSLTFLGDIGVAASRVTVLDDDEVELGYRARHESCGTALGVNVREDIGDVIEVSAERLGAAIRPLSMSSYDEEEDRHAEQVLLTLPECRIVVTGSYHAAVFALSMGIPTIGIANCDYYAYKFRGLAEQFGPACRVEFRSHPDFSARLVAGIEGAWRSAPTMRQSLLRSAVRQVALGKVAYRKLFALVERRASFTWLSRH